MHKERSFRKTSKHWLDESIHAAHSLGSRQGGVREAYEQLLGLVCRQTTLLRPARDPRRLGRCSLLRQVEEWHRQLGRDDTLPALVWTRSSIGEFQYVEGTEQQENLRFWTVRELLTSRELFLEGQALRHCVASYAADCARRRTTIWSLLVDTGQGPHRALTVEVDPGKRTIRQARGKGNRLPRQAERAVLERWAAREALRIADPL